MAHAVAPCGQRVRPDNTQMVRLLAAAAGAPRGARLGPGVHAAVLVTYIACPHMKKPTVKQILFE